MTLQGLFPTIPCIPAIHGGQMCESGPRPPSTSGRARAGATCRARRGVAFTSASEHLPWLDATSAARLRHRCEPLPALWGAPSSPRTHHRPAGHRRHRRAPCRSRCHTPHRPRTALIPNSSYQSIRHALPIRAPRRRPRSRTQFQRTLSACPTVSSRAQRLYASFLSIPSLPDTAVLRRLHPLNSTSSILSIAALNSLISHPDAPLPH